MGNNKANGDFISSKNYGWFEKNNINNMLLNSKEYGRKYNTTYEISLEAVHEI